MMNLPEMLGPLFSAAATRLVELLSEFTSPNNRWFLGYFAVTLLIAGGIYLSERARQARSWGDFWTWAVPRASYGRRSLGVDAGLIVVNQLLVPGAWLVEALALRDIDDWIVQLGRAEFGGPLVPGHPGMLVQWLIGLFVFCVLDFGMFLHHWLQHRFPVLWELHRVHHSAEHMNPLTADRFHPLEVVLKGLLIVPMVGLAVGVMGIIFDADIVRQGFNLVNIWLFMRAFSLIGSNLRHTHIWWSWPKPIALIFSTPAQHQIHHSIDPQHYGKNLGSVLNCWDRLFGTFYLAHEREHIVFGVNEGQNHHSVGWTLWQPLLGIWRLLAARWRSPVHGQGGG